eukprot:TRINITY_DN12813_c0_g4_i1.p1 TRINITY_DN12813_c0_g4~~TRINITY_DN12813_c0_g4_i1.p1  ORF type:complete len:289 (+),score=71.70 TRINITY_DN12813_c0_g4_i1:726-1592(+)
MKYTHLKCLRLWMNQNIQIKQRANCTTIVWKLLDCELCKTPYPFAVYFNGKIYELIDCQLPQPPYAVFECYYKNSLNSNGLHIISFSDKPILKLGRQISNDVVMNDISVSRYQAALQWEDDSLFMADLNSKFGTLVQLRQPTTVKDGMQVQCGNYLLELRVNRAWSIFGCFKVGSLKAGEKGKCYAEDTKTFPGECLPGAGRHSVLVITRKEYNKLLKPSDKIRRVKTPVSRQLYKISSKETIPGVRSFVSSKKLLYPRISTIRKFRHTSVSLMKLKGDDADDIDDCQ